MKEQTEANIKNLEKFLIVDLQTMVDQKHVFNNTLARYLTIAFQNKPF